MKENLENGMIVKEGVTIYKCSFCNKKMFVKRAMENHINWCSSNPKNFKRCADGCAHLEETSVDYEVDYIYGDGGSQTKQAKAFRCKKLDKLLYPLIVERKGLLNKYPETFEDQEPMPKECEHFKDAFDF